FLFIALSLLFTPLVWAQGITVRIMPPNRAQFLQFQKFDVRIEATATGATASISDLRVTLDGRDITSIGQVANPSPGVRTWTFRNRQVGIFADRVLAATATGTTGSASISGSKESRITIRQWRSAAPNSAAAALDAGWSAPNSRGRVVANDVADP